MVTQDEVMGLLLEACPKFRPRWEDYLVHWYGTREPEELIPMSDVAQFSSYLVEEAKAGRTTCFAQVFTLMERLLVEGSEDVQYWVTVGCLEDLQNIASNRDIDYKIFEPWLGERTKTEWRGLIDYWGD